MTNSLLIIDDEEIALRNLSHAFRKHGYEVATCADGESALRELSQRAFDVVLTDLRMPGIDGMAVLAECQQRWPSTRVIMLTGYATIENAVAAMKAGAYHYLSKPFHLEEVRELVNRALQVISLERENHLLREQINALQPKEHIITQNKNFLELLELGRKIAATNCNVLISGESGTGKELMARFIHKHSPRRHANFVAFNCGALHDELLDNELFGHERGAFSGAREQRKGLIETAVGGTLFLDEIGETSPRMQVKLLRVLEERELYRVGGNQALPIDVRFLAATNRNLVTAVEDGRFRQDLYFRINVTALHLPPLAARRDDIPLLVRHFLHKVSARIGRTVRDITPEALQLLTSYDYPGNIRELINLIERSVILADGELLEVYHLPDHLRAVRINVIRELTSQILTLEEQERRHILEVIKHTDGNRTQAARILGIDRVSLWRKLKNYGIKE